jgi:hypothetical protein
MQGCRVVPELTHDLTNLFIRSWGSGSWVVRRQASIVGGELPQALRLHISKVAI